MIGSRPAVDALTRRRAGWGLLVLGGAALVVAPYTYFTSGYQLDVARLALYLAALAGGWSFLAGVAGQFSFAHVTIAGVAGYAGAIWSRDAHGSVWTSIAVGVGCGLAVGVLLGLLLRRLSGAYLALFTIAFAEVTRLVAVAEQDLTGGRLGLAVNPMLPGGPITHYYWLLAAAAGVLAVVYAVLRSRIGLYVRAMREDVTAAAAMGVNVRLLKLFALGLGALLASVPGALYFHTTSPLVPENLDLLLMSQVIAYAVVGGLESPLAAAAAALVFSLVLEQMREISWPWAEVLGIAVALVVVPAIALVRATGRGGWRPAVGALPWLVPAVALTGWWLFAPPGTPGAAGTMTGWPVVVVAFALVARAGTAGSGVARAGTSGGAASPGARVRALAALLGVGVVVGAKLATLGDVVAELGVWRLAVFGALLALTLRFAPNGLFTPALDFFAGASARRRLAVAPREAARRAATEAAEREVVS